MRAVEVELLLLTLPLVEPFTTATGTVADREVVVVHVVTDDGEGWGECVALPEPTYTSEYARGAFDVLEHHLVPRLWSIDALEVGPVARALAPVQGHHMAKAAVEMAVLDLTCAAGGVSLRSWLGGTRKRIPAGVAIGIPGSVEELVGVVERRVAEGYRRVKVKIRPGWDRTPLVAVRRAVGDAVVLVADANGAYRLEDVAELAALDEVGLAALEQPLPADDLEGHTELARRLATPLCLDESVGSARAAALALDVGACAAVSVKPGRLGGLVEARRVHDVCVARSAGAWVGGMLETGIGRAAALALASLPGFSSPGDLAASSRYFARDVVPGAELDGDGMLVVPNGPGLGVAVDRSVLDGVTARRRVLRPRR